MKITNYNLEVSDCIYFLIMNFKYVISDLYHLNHSLNPLGSSTTLCQASGRSEE